MKPNLNRFDPKNPLKSLKQQTALIEVFSVQTMLNQIKEIGQILDSNSEMSQEKRLIFINLREELLESLGLQ